MTKARDIADFKFEDIVEQQHSVALQLVKLDLILQLD